MIHRTQQLVVSRATAIVLAVVCFVIAPWAVLAFTKPSGSELPDLDQRKRSKEQKPMTPGRQAALEKLRRLQPGLRVDFDEWRNTPKHVLVRHGFLSGPKGEGRTIPPGRARQFGPAEVHPGIKAFLTEHAGLFGHGPEILDGAVVRRDFVASRNGLRTTVWEQRLDGIGVYEGVFIGHETAQGELVSISSLMIPDAARAADLGTPNRAARQAAPPISVETAIALAASQIGELVKDGEVVATEARPAVGDLRQRFKAGALPGETVASLVWLPMGDESLRLCWQVEATRRTRGERYRILIDAVTGEMQLRQCLTVYLQPASFRVFTSDSPSPFSPGWPFPNTNQPPLIQRSLVTLSALNTNASPLGWIGDGENETRGNNVDAHLDLDADDLPDLPRPQGVPFRVFDPPLNLDSAPGASRDAAVVQLFYWCNWIHDQLYDLGFDEGAGNFQKDNLGRGGLGRDAIQADAQDGSGVDNANFTPAPDGEPGRIQMFIWSSANPARDGDLDAEVVLHEYVHGLSSRLVGGGVGIGSLQSAGMGEGWSDFYALSLLSESGDDVDGSYPFGGYASRLLGGLQENYYFGIRRYPYSTDMTKNPLTFKDADPIQISPHDGVPRNPLDPFNPINAAEVHSLGEIWCTILWDARANLVRAHGYAEGNRLMLQLVTDGMRLCPPNPTFLQARDAILLADLVDNAGGNQPDLWRAFAKRGMGFSAQGPDTMTTVGVIEGFDVPDPLFIATVGGLFASGPLGGPFAPGCLTLALTNLSDQPIRWAAGNHETWLQISPSSGVLPPGTSTNLMACLAAGATVLPLGNYDDLITVANLDSGVSQTRPAELRVMIFRTLPFFEGFETGEIEDYWSVSGTGRHRAQVTRLNLPHSGEYHLTLDADGGVRSRNELTLGLDLAGYTNVVLKFWAKSFGDEPDGPPTSPFIGGADFDGVAISEDGVRWYEARGLRNVPFDYSRITVDLDAAIKAFGLHYSSGFRVRFNQVDDFQIPFDGLAFDDIEITGIPAQRFHVDVASRVPEGAGTLVNAGQVSVGSPVSQDLVVALVSSHPERLSVSTSVVISAGRTNATFNLTIPDNDLLDGTEAIEISASADGFQRGLGSVQVIDDEVATLRVKLPAKATEGTGLLKRQGVVRASARLARDVVVRLTSSLPGIVKVPSVVTLPAGQRDAEFDLEILDDDRIQGPRQVEIMAHVENWIDGRDTMTVLDNDDPALLLDLPRDIGEANGVMTNAGRVRVSGLLATNLVVTLTSSDRSLLRVPVSVVIPSNTWDTAVTLEPVDDVLVNGRRTATITAKAVGFAGASAVIGVLDDETPVTPYSPRPADGATNIPVAVSLEWGTGRGELMINGGFETGDFSGWITTNAGFGVWIINDGEVDPDGPDGPIAPLAGKYEALTLQNGAGLHGMSQNVFIPAEVQSATLRWTDRIHNHADYFSIPNQQYRVEIRDTNDVILATAFQTDPGTNLFPAVRRTFDVSRYRGQTVRVSFFQQDNLGYLNVGVDEVSVMLGDFALGTGTGAGASSGLSYDVYLGTSATLGAANRIANTTNGSWNLPNLALNTTYYWQIVARLGTAAVRGPVWHFRTRGVGPVDHFEFTPISSPQAVGERLAIAVTARDDINNPATSFVGPVTLRGVRGSGQRSRVLISEVDVGPTDQVEFVNADNVEIDLSGWTISLYDVASWPAPTFELRIPDGTRCGAGRFFVLTELADALGRFPEFKIGTNVNWNAAPMGNPVAVLLTDASGKVVDFVAAGDARPTEIRKPIRIPSSEWQGVPAAVAFIPNSGFTLQRQGLRDTDTADDWVVAGSTFGASNLKLSLPQSRRDVIEVVPGNLTNFTTAIWSGYVTVTQPASSMVLEVTDSFGHSGTSKEFAVGVKNDVAVAVEATPGVALVGDAVAYRIAVTNTGPDRATGLRLTNQLPPEVVFISSSTFDGACTPTGQTVVCQLNELGPGDSAQVELQTEAHVMGLATNWVGIGRAGLDGLAANNFVSTWSTITGPLITTTNVSLTEGSSITNVARFPVILSSPCRWPVTVRYMTSNQTATAGSDYIAVEGTLVFAPGVTNLSVSVPIIPDRMDEGFEQFAFVLFEPSNGVVAVPPMRCRILDDDPVPSLSVFDATVVEGPVGGRTNMIFQIQLSTASALNVFVNYATVDGTAKAPLDYKPAAGTVFFPPGTTNQFVSVEVRGDFHYEPNETFTLHLDQSVSASLARSDATGTILDDDADEVDHFEWSEVPSPQYAAFPFAARLAAKDGLGRDVTTYAGTVELSAVADSRSVDVGAGTNRWFLPFGTFFHATRMQTLYLPEELGGSGSLNAIGFDLLTAPGQTLSNWTIRVKHFPERRFSTAAWESAGWTTVYRKDESILDPGPATFFFDRPFAYNGVDALLVEFSFHNPNYSEDGIIRSTVTDSTRTLYFQSDGGFGDPLSWTGTTPTPAAVSQIPNARFQFERPLATDPDVPVVFSSGVWAGNMTIYQTGTNVFLRANDGLGRVAVSAPFNILSGDDANGDGIPDAWEAAAFGSVGTAAGRPEADPDGDGRSNWEEYVAGSNPRDAGSVLSIRSIDSGPGWIRLRFPTVAGRRYFVERATIPASAGPAGNSAAGLDWRRWGGAGQGTGGEITVTVPNELGLGQFFRIRVTP